MNSISPRFSAMTPQAGPAAAPMANRTPTQPAATPSAAPQVQFGGGDYSKGRIAAAVGALAALVMGGGLGLNLAGVTENNVPDHEIATVKDAAGHTKGYIEEGQDFKGDRRDGMVFDTERFMAGKYAPTPLYGALSDTFAGVVEDGRAFDAEGNLVCSTDGTDIMHHNSGEPEGKKIGSYEAVGGGAVFTNLAGDKQATTTRKLQNEGYNLSANNQAAAACLLDVIDQTKGKAPKADPVEPAADQEVVNGEVVNNDAAKPDVKKDTAKK